MLDGLLTLTSLPGIPLFPLSFSSLPYSRFVVIIVGFTRLGRVLAQQKDLLARESFFRARQKHLIVSRALLVVVAHSSPTCTFDSQIP